MSSTCERCIDEYLDGNEKCSFCGKEFMGHLPYHRNMFESYNLSDPKKRSKYLGRLSMIFGIISVFISLFDTPHVLSIVSFVLAIVSFITYRKSYDCDKEIFPALLGVFTAVVAIVIYN